MATNAQTSLYTCQPLLSCFLSKLPKGPLNDHESLEEVYLYKDWFIGEITNIKRNAVTKTLIKIFILQPPLPVHHYRALLH